MTGVPSIQTLSRLPLTSARYVCHWPAAMVTGLVPEAMGAPETSLICFQTPQVEVVSTAKRMPWLLSVPCMRRPSMTEAPGSSMKASKTSDVSLPSRWPTRLCGRMSPPHVTGLSGTIWRMTVPCVGSFDGTHSQTPFWSVK